MEKEQYIPQELFEHYDIKLFDINRTNNVYDLILKMWNENKELEERINKVIEFIDSESPDAGVSGYEIKKILKGEEK